ncbi:DUF2243 domain-containing protein [Variovorax sp. J22G73]|uniref:DUF2243 domain-containing protein n=1 Tax=unclassified Variovorax TaxID=663243 RepID=UPI0025757C46|nr:MULTISPECIES: DUF2243 domain-containing protein [unclassified Variovorax]MDM0010574.1 DUF2243 domain-containing protein [Variovorax sp. J22R203]MDM0103097.1 DUF2243 domain-containing protein [Variovorax sp. J22G73]
MRADPSGTYPASAGILFGLGLGGFFDGIVLHQLLQWHHMLSSWYPPTTLENLRLNTLWDGIFHSATYIFVILAVYRLWQAARRGQVFWSGKLIWGTGFIGWGAFNLVEGLIDHHLLGIHHVNELVGTGARQVWDVAFLVWGAAMLIAGSWLWRWGARDHQAKAVLLR